MRYMHDEALLALPELLTKLDIEAPVLLGHSDGGSISLIHAGARLRPVVAVVTLAAHVVVEDISVASIAAAKTAYETTDLRARLAATRRRLAFWRSGAGTGSGCIPISEPGTSRSTCRISRVQCWRFRVRTTSMGRWSR